MIQSFGIIALTIIGVSILLWGIYRRGIFRISVGAMILILDLYASAIWFPSYSQAITAASTTLLVIAILFLAIVIIWSERQRRQHDDKIRTQDRERDDRLRDEQKTRDDTLRAEEIKRATQNLSIEREREFKKLCLREIQVWAQDGIKYVNQFKMPLTIDQQEQLRLNLEPLNAMNIWIIKAATQFSDEEFTEAVKIATDNIKTYCWLTKTQKEVTTVLGNCTQSLNDVIKAVADLRAKWE